MPSLRELQTAFVAATFGAPDALLEEWIVADGIEPADRLAIYRRNTHHNLREALRDVYPVVERLVGEDFFAAAANRYLREHPSTSGNLHDFGASFAAFVKAYPPARGLPYLGDTARLEWRVHLAFHAADRAALSLARLREVDPDDYGRLRFSLHPSCRLLASRYPVHRIWEVNQPGHTGPDTVDLASGPVRLLVRRAGFAIVVDPLGPGQFALLSALAKRHTLSNAAARALAAEPGFDLGRALAALAGGSVLVDFALAGVNRGVSASRRR